MVMYWQTVPGSILNPFDRRKKKIISNYQIIRIYVKKDKTKSYNISKTKLRFQHVKNIIVYSKQNY